MKLILVESPNKIKSIQKYVGKEYIVKATVGHFRSLPTKQLAVNLDTLEETYEIAPDKGGVLQEIINRIKKYNIHEIFLATDPDREGEAIAWHVEEEIKKRFPGIKFRRILFHEITQSAVEKAISQPKDINYDLVEAQRTRRVIDRLTGYMISPLLAEKFKRRGLSAGRVQSAALQLLATREKEIQNFKPEDYWKVHANYIAEPSFRCIVRQVEANGEWKEIKRLDESKAFFIRDYIQSVPHVVRLITKKEQKKHPQPPFTTSTLQQEANSKLGFTPQYTMKIAQQLFEGKGNGGFITYHRTDSVNLSSEAIRELRSFIKKKYGDGLLPEEPPKYKSKEGSQEAHEAIRPTSLTLDLSQLSEDEKKLYILITKRALSSQMNPAVYDLTEVTTQAGDKFLLSTKGKILKEKGYTIIYEEETEENEHQDPLEDDNNVILPELEEGQKVEVQNIHITKHTTKAPSRYTQRSLIQALERYQVGRPSTFATILDILEKRKYVELKSKKYHVTDIGLFVVHALEEFFPQFISVESTAKMENNLDNISEGEASRKKILKEFLEQLQIAINEASNKMPAKQIETNNQKINCYLCHSEMQVYDKFAKCSCGLKVFKKCYGKVLTDHQFMTLLTKGKTSVIKGFPKKSKEGTFQAALYIDKEKKNVQLSFSK